eukprot:gene27170-1053_t
MAGGFRQRCIDDRGVDAAGAGLRGGSGAEDGDKGHRAGACAVFSPQPPLQARVLERAAAPITAEHFASLVRD